MRRLGVTGLIAVWVVLAACTETGAAPPPPAVADQMVGRWLPADRGEPAFLELTLTGWTGSDGCNSAVGVWSADRAGALSTGTTGGRTQKGCDNSEVLTWIDQAEAARVEGDVLILVGPDGTESGRLRRAG